jgi:hypothetical protein
VTVRRQRPDLSEFDLSDVVWTISSHSGGGGDCVKVGRLGDWVLVGDTKCPDRLPLVCSVSEAQAWILGAKGGAFGTGGGLV